MFNSYTYNKTSYCTAINSRCNAFLCKDYRLGFCRGILWALADNDGAIIAQIPALNDEDENIWHYIMKAIEEIHKRGYLAKDEVIDTLESKYKIKLSRRMLKYYGTVWLIEPGIVTQLPGIRGSVSLYKENAPKIINFINILKRNRRFTLKKIIELSNVLNFKNRQKLEKYWSYYETYRVKNNSLETILAKYTFEISDFEIFLIQRALIEVGKLNSTDDSSPTVDVDVIKNKNGEFEIIVEFENPNVKVIFKKDGVTVI